MKREEFDIIAAGHLCLDIFPRFAGRKAGGEITEIFRPGTLIQMEGMTFSTGGSVSNVGIAMKIFGCRVAFIAKIGGDRIGRIIIDILEKSGSAEGIKISPGEESSYTVVLAPPGIDRIFLHCPGANDTFSLKSIDLALVENTRLFHLGYPTLMRSLFSNNGKELTAVLKKVKETGATTSLDISLPDPDSEAGRSDWRTIYRKALPYVDIFFPSIEEAFFTLYPEEYLRRKEGCGGKELIDHIAPEEFSSAADEYLKSGCKMIALKAGHKGWYFKSAAKLKGLGKAAPREIESWRGRELWCPAYYIENIASATGSGDSSIAAFLTALLRGHSLEESLKLANCAGFQNLKKMDALSGLTSWPEMKRAVPVLKVRDNRFLSGTSWRWNEPLSLWEK